MKFITGSPNILDKKNLLKKIGSVIDSGILTNNGPRVKELEEKFECLTGVPGVAVCNATAGLETLIELTTKTHSLFSTSIEVNSFTFIATVHSILKNPNLSPKFIDVDNFYQADPSSNKFIVSNLFGSCGQLKNTGIYDNAHGLGVKYQNKSIAEFGLASVYSLHATKFLNGIEGGIIASKNKDLIQKIKQYRNFGYKNFSPKIFSGEIDSIGTNYKMSELHAVVAAHHIDYIKYLIDLNKERYEWYKEYLPEECKLITYPDAVDSNYSYIVIRVDKSVREHLCQELLDKGIYTRQYFIPAHKTIPYKKFTKELKNTEVFAEECLCLPQGIQIKSKEDVIFICQNIRNILRSKVSH